MRQPGGSEGDSSDRKRTTQVSTDAALGNTERHPRASNGDGHPRSHRSGRWSGLPLVRDVVLRRYGDRVGGQTPALIWVEVLFPLVEAVEPVEEHRTVGVGRGDLTEAGVAGEDVTGHLLEAVAGDAVPEGA